ncbi:MAG: hypothetical protein JXA57_11970 [Armatimonadetes bacterium]|nr:hypothetical protein [Armatimonadota bacterium]
MRWCAFLAGLALMGGLIFTGLGGDGAFGSAGGAMTMYSTIDVTGVLTAAQELYREKDLVVFSGRLRVASVEGAEKPKVGELVAVEYPAIVPQARRMGLGDELQLSVNRQPTVKAGTHVWVATAPPTVLGRGEFINPGEQPTKDLGSPGARVLVKMFAPMRTDCHRETAEKLEELAKQEPERLRVQLFDMQTNAGRTEMAQERLQCATVLVNNRLYFTLSQSEQTRKVAFHHRPNTSGSTYCSEDVVTVVKQEIERLYAEK